MDLLTRAEELLRRARAAGLMIATAESCTGGLIAATLTEIPGSSDVVDCGFVTYSNGAKTRMLGVPAALIETHGAVSSEVVRAMAEGALARSTADLAVAVSGVAGPGGSNAKPEGRVCFGLAGKGRRTLVETVEFGVLGRSKVREATVAHALDLLLGCFSQTV